MLYDNYDDEAMGYRCEGGVRVRLPHDNVDPETLNGPVKVYFGGTDHD